MVSLDDSIVIRLKSYGETFEVMADPDMALKYRAGDISDIESVVAVDNVFKDAKAGDRASEDSIKKVFQTSDINEVISQVLKKGELHLTTEQKKTMLEERKRQIVTLIARNAVNPQTGAPHPPARIEDALDEVRFMVTISKSAKEQVDAAVKAIRPILPIKFEKRKIAVKIPAQYSGNVHNIFREFGDIEKEQWAGTSLIILITIPAGLQDEFYSKANNITHGEAEIKVVE